MIEEIEIFTSTEVKLNAHHATPDGDQNVGLNHILVVMLHGFPGSQKSQLSLFPTLEQQLLAQGFHCLRFDFRGCGDSEGQPEDFTLSSAHEDLQGVLSWAHHSDYKRFIFVGEGLGASIALMNCREDTASMCLLWPIVDFQHLIDQVYNARNIEEQWKKAGYILHGDHRISVQLIEELHAAKIETTLQNVDAPLLIMHGSNDEMSPIERLDFIREHAKSRRIEITSFQDGKHGLPDNEHRKMMQYHIMQFVQKYI